MKRLRLFKMVLAVVLFYTIKSNLAFCHNYDYNDKDTVFSHEGNADFKSYSNTSDGDRKINSGNYTLTIKGTPSNNSYTAGAKVLWDNSQTTHTGNRFIIGAESSEGYNALGYYVEGDTPSGAKLNLNSDITKINAIGGQYAFRSVGIFALNGDIASKGDELFVFALGEDVEEVHGILLDGGKAKLSSSKITLKADSQTGLAHALSLYQPGTAMKINSDTVSFEANTDNEDYTAAGIHVESGAELSVSAQDINISAINKQGNVYGINANGDLPVVGSETSATCTQGKVELHGNTQISVLGAGSGDKKDYARAINVYGARVSVNWSEADEFDTKIDGNIIAVSYSGTETGELKRVDGQIDLALKTEDSYFRGSATNYYSEFSNTEESRGIINIKMDNGAQWYMQPSEYTTHDTNTDNRITTLSISNAARVDMTNTTDWQRLVVEDELSGNGIFTVKTDIKNDKTDQVIIGKGTGRHQIEVMPTGTGADREAMDSFIVQQHDGDASFSLANEDGKVEQGLYFYELADRAGSDGQEWYLKRSGIAPETPTGEAEASLSGLAGHYAMWYGQLTDLRKRLGEVRYGTQTGLWVRGFADKSRLDGLAGSSFTQNLYGGSIGYDTLLADSGQYNWIVGMQLRSAHADQSTNGQWGGHGKLTSMGGGLYSTWAHTDGWYVDAAATMDWYNHKIRATMRDGTRVHDDRSSYGLGASLEAGRKIDFGFSNEGRDHWFVEPQLQLSYFWVKGGDFTASNGMEIDQKDMDSLTGRAGLVLGKKFALDGGNGSRYIQPYVKAGLNHEFLGEQEAHLNGVRMTSDLEGTRGYYGVGVDWQATDNLRLYMQAEREHGEHFTREYNVSAGLKWSF